MIRKHIKEGFTMFLGCLASVSMFYFFAFGGNGGSAAAANEVLLSSFDFTETYVYPDNYAGAFIEGDVLHIRFTDEEGIEKYKTTLKDYENFVVFEIAEYSYNELEAAADVPAKNYALYAAGAAVIILAIFLGFKVFKKNK